MDYSNKDTNEVSSMSTHELPVLWDKADDYYVYDEQGKKYIDFTSGIFVANAGHSATKEAIKEQADKLVHSYVFANKPRLELSKKLCKITGMDKVLLTVTGSEANDAVIQMIHRFKEGRILTLKGAYYGSTIACKNLCRGLTDTIDEKTLPTNPDGIACVFLQIFRGKDAKLVPHSWIEAWHKWAKENNILFGIDEMQSGIGRTGKWFGYQHYNIKPDFITIGKALGGGLPISAVIGRKDLLELSDDLWSTHTGNPVCCASALATINAIQKLIKKTDNRNDWVRGLLRISFREYLVNGQGLMWAIETGDKRLTQRTIEKCAENGLLLVSTHGKAIKIAPPLTISDKALVEGIRILRRCLN